MVDFLKRVFGAADSDAPEATRTNTDIRIATCALFLELASIDNEFSDEERHEMLAILQKEYGLSETHAVELAEAAVEELKGSIDVWQFTNQINENYSQDEKMRVVELLWRLVYADGKLDAHEDYLMHKLGKLLRLQHRQLIAAKLKVLREEG
jgi:uncharacterized tellurite resistance protein B-like protein